METDLAFEGRGGGFVAVGLWPRNCILLGHLRRMAISELISPASRRIGRESSRPWGQPMRKSDRFESYHANQVTKGSERAAGGNGSWKGEMRCWCTCPGSDRVLSGLSLANAHYQEGSDVSTTGWVRDVEPDDETRAEGNKVQRVKPQDVDVISWGRVKAKVLLDTVKSHGGVVTPISPTGHARLWTYHTHLLTRYLESAQKFSWDQIQAYPYCTHSLALNRRWALNELSMAAYGCCSYRSCALFGNYLNYAYSNIRGRRLFTKLRRSTLYAGQKRTASI
ncbi:hypothetical protein CISG_02389 [Coccidioides immitis RMSCC 3703]|uniref:Uncharacterized protein n=1 Tax=Coccidioides immitis RMSCC 3703 TaxID=454286 RepID=A0A0J8R9P3_COCIT|nr:hypothetical protein CISG_02389 [Coccidioides immitis RMSCC 3703]